MGQNLYARKSRADRSYDEIKDLEGKGEHITNISIRWAQQIPSGMSG